MALTADYNTGSVSIKKATFRLLRIWGSKQEGWNAWVGVFLTSTQEVHDEQFSVSVPYVEGQNPFDALYSAVGKLSFIENVAHDVVTDLNKVAAPVVEEVNEAEVKPKRSKKA